MLREFIKYYRPHRKLFLMDMCAAFLVSLIGIVYPIVTRRMLNDLIPNKNYQMIVFSGLMVLLMYFIKMMLNYFIQYQGHMMGVYIQAQMRRDMFNHLEKLPYSFYDNHETGKIMSRMTNDLMDISELAHHGPENIIISSISVIISFVYLVHINVWLTLIIFSCVPLLLVVSMRLRTRMRDAFMESRKSIAVINSSLESSISGIRVTKAFTNSKKESEKFEKGNQAFISARRLSYKAMGQFHSSTTFITDVFNVIVLIAGGLFLYAGQISFGDYSAFVVSINMFINPVNTLINFMEQYQNGVTGFQRFLEILSVEPEKDSENAKDYGTLKGKIVIKDLQYAYDKEDVIIDHLSLNVEKGQTVALVGPSGGGKTTLCHLIPQFYNVPYNQMFIDDKEIHQISKDCLRKNIGIVQQDVFLFNASIRDNILYGKLDATEEEIIEAAKRANIHDFIMSLEEQYDTQIGERGVRLSGGQKQRLSIARVFLKNPSILILDEATSALDNTTEILIQQALNELCKGRTTLVVAHRLSTIKNADKIAVILDGKVSEEGTHEQLMQLNGVYKKLYMQQFRDD